MSLVNGTKAGSAAIGIVIVAGIGEVVVLLPGGTGEGTTFGGVRLPEEMTTGGVAALDRVRLLDTAVAVLLVATMTMTGVTVSALRSIGGVVRIGTIVLLIRTIVLRIGTIDLRIGIIATAIVDIVLEEIKTSRRGLL